MSSIKGGLFPHEPGIPSTDYYPKSFHVEEMGRAGAGVQAEISQKRIDELERLIFWLCSNTHYVGFAAASECPEKKLIDDIVLKFHNR